MYFACHGTRDGDGLPRLVVEDTRSKTLVETAITVADVEAWMRESGAGQLVLMLDACHMGQGTNERDLVADPEFLSAVYEGPPEGFALLAASTAEQTSREFGNLEHGLFSYYVLSGLSGAAKTANSARVTVGSLKRYVLGELMREAVRAGVPQRPQGRLMGDLDMEDVVLVDNITIESDSPSPPKGSQVDTEDIAEALLRAFPSKKKLKMMLFYGLDKDLEVEVNADGPLREVVFILIMLADEKDLRLDLIQSAYKANPRKSELKKIANTLGLSVS